MLQIRNLESYHGCFDLLCASVEDVPQLTITLLFAVYTGFESATALLNIAFSLLTLFWCPIAIIVGWCGCRDDTHKDVKEEENDDSPPSTQMVLVTAPTVAGSTVSNLQRGSGTPYSMSSNNVGISQQAFERVIYV